MLTHVLCVVKSLKNVKEKDNFYQKFFIPVAVILVVGVCITSVLFVQNRLPKCHTLKRCKLLYIKDIPLLIA
jgi:hypothetical protein